MNYGEYLLLKLIRSYSTGVCWALKWGCIAGLDCYTVIHYWQFRMLADRHLWRVCSSLYKSSTRVAGGKWTRSRGHPGSHPTPINAGDYGHFGYMMLRFQRTCYIRCRSNDKSSLRTGTINQWSFVGEGESATWKSLRTLELLDFVKYALWWDDWYVVQIGSK